MPLLPTLVTAIESPVGIWAFTGVGAESLVLILGPGLLWLPNTSPNVNPLARTNKYTLSHTNFSNVYVSRHSWRSFQHSFLKKVCGSPLY